MRTIAMASLDTICLDLENRSTPDGEISAEEDIGLINTEMDPLRSLLHSTDPIDRDLRMRLHEGEEIEARLHILAIDNHGHLLNHICMIVYPRPYECGSRLEVKYSSIIHGYTRHDEILELHSLEYRDLEFSQDTIIEYDGIFVDCERRCRDLFEKHRMRV